jgi:hypothetical protein
MPKAGAYTYPINDVDSVLSKLRKFYDVAKTDACERFNVAESLGMAERGGGFANLISDMEKYGFIETGGGKVKITEAGKLALFGTPTETDHAKSNAVSKIDMFRDLFRVYGVNPTIEQIKAFLRQKANLGVDVAQNLAPKVDTIYKKVSNYITSAESLEAAPTPVCETVEASSAPSIGPSVGRGDIVIPETTATKIQPLKVQFGEVYIQIPAGPNSLESIKLAIDTLEFMRQRLQKQQGTESS